MCLHACMCVCLCYMCVFVYVHLCMCESMSHITSSGAVACVVCTDSCTAYPYKSIPKGFVCVVCTCINVYAFVVWCGVSGLWACVCTCVWCASLCIKQQQYTCRHDYYYPFPVGWLFGCGNSFALLLHCCIHVDVM